MSNDKKAKKEARRLRDAALHQKRVLFEDRTRTAVEEVEYVLEPDAQQQETGQSVSPIDAQDAAKRYAIDSDSSSDDETVHVAKRGRESDDVAAARRKRTAPKLTAAELKGQIIDRYGPDEGGRIARMVDEHDGNAEDPLFTVGLKTMRNAVPVPYHWANKGSFLKDQVDRESSDWIVPADVEATEVRDVRVKKDQKNLNIRAFVTCFLTDSPFMSKTFNMRLTKQGDVFFQGKWWPKRRPQPGVLSDRLRAALGMTSATSPPPFLYGMQSLRALPPAYPNLFIPGLNAPIPAGAAWGNAEGQWGNPARNESNNFMFPTVMESEYEAALQKASRRPWGSIPAPTVQSAAAAPPPKAPDATSQPATSVAVSPPPAVIAPVFNEQRFVGAVATGVANRQAFVEQEYRVLEGTNGGVVAVGGTLVPRQGGLPTPPAAVIGKGPGQQPHNTNKF